MKLHIEFNSDYGRLQETVEMTNHEIMNGFADPEIFTKRMDAALDRAIDMCKDTHGCDWKLSIKYTDDPIGKK